MVGHPVAELLLRRFATVTIAHSRTPDLTAVSRAADIVIAAAGVPSLIGAPRVAPGAAVIDVGIHRTASGLVGGVRFEEIFSVAGWITPVPGGVGPMTIAALLANTITAAETAGLEHDGEGMIAGQTRVDITYLGNEDLDLRCARRRRRGVPLTTFRLRGLRTRDKSLWFPSGNTNDYRVKRFVSGGENCPN